MNTDTLILVSAIASAVSALVLIVLLLKVGKVAAVAQLKSEQLAGTAITAKDLGKELGASIENAFKAYVPQPDKLSSSVTGAVELSVKKAAEGIDALHKNMLAGQTQAAEKWSAHEKSTVAGLEAAKKALDDVAGKLAASVNTASDKLTAAVNGATEKLQGGLAAHSQQVEKIEAASRDQLKGLLAQHAESVQKAGQAIAGQLDKIMQLEKEIQQVLHIQQAVDGTLKQVAASDEFKQTLAALRSHLEASDSLIKEVAKPRTIRLVESDA